MSKIENWLLNKFVGKIVARLCITIAAYIASTQVQSVLNRAGIHGVTINPAELSAAIIAGGHAVFEAYKAWRNKTTIPDSSPVVPPSQAS